MSTNFQRMDTNLIFKLDKVNNVELQEELTAVTFNQSDQPGNETLTSDWLHDMGAPPSPHASNLPL